MSDSLQQPNLSETPPSENDKSAEMRALAAAYAFGAVDPADAERVREAMAQDADIGDEIQSYRRLFTVMHYTSPPISPPEALETKLREATIPSASPIAQPYTGPGSEAARREMENDIPNSHALAPNTPAVGADASAHDTPLQVQGGEHIGYWPSTPAPAASGRPAVAANPFLAGANRVNPLTGRSMPPTASPSPAPPVAAGSVYPRQNPPNPPAAQRGSKSASGSAAAPRRVQQSAVRAPAPASSAIPEAFRTVPIAQTTRSNSQRGAWIGWATLLVALALLVGTNYFWYTTSQQTSAQQQQTLTQVAQLQTDLAASAESVSTLQQAADDASVALATNQATITELRTALDEATAALADAEANLAAASPQQAAGMGMSDNVLSALAQGSLEEAMLQPMNATDAMTATARIVWNPDMQSGMLLAMNMPALAEGRTYQLWLVSGGVPTSAGMFVVDDRGMGMLELSDMPIGDYEVAAVTAEPMTGSPAPTSTILIAGEL
jgi:anti-sigma-K factor RskA